MPTLSSGDKVTLRKNMQKSKVYMSIFRPTVIAEMTIEAIPDKRNIDVTVDSGNSGLIEAGMTAIINGTNSTIRVGKVRVKGFDSDGRLLLAENDLNMNVGDSIVVLKYWEMWPVYHRVEVDGDDLIVYQDYDIEYDDQNEQPDPIVIMGSHVAKDMQQYGSTNIYWTASGTWSPVDADLDEDDFVWELEGGSPAIYTGITPGWVEYETAGHFWTKLTVTDGNGKSFVGRRAAIVHNTFEPPYTAFEIRSLSGGWDEFGWTAEVVVHQDVPYAYHLDNALVILWHDSWYNTTKREFGTQIDRGHILFTGWIEGDSITRLPFSDNTSFRMSGAGPYLKQTLNFPVTLEHTNGTPDKWWLINDLTIDNAVRFFLRNSSTVLTLCDFHQSGQTLLTKYFDYGEDTISNAINNATYDRGAWVRFASDHYSALYLAEEPQIHSGTTTYVLEMADEWWRDQISFSHRQRTNVAWTELSGVNFDGDEAVAKISMAPGDAPLWDGNQQVVGGLICPDQQTLNIWAGRYLGWKNNSFPEANVPMAGNFAGVFDVIPPEVVLIDFTGEDNKPKYVMNDAPFLVRGVEHQYDGLNLLTNLRLELLANGDPGVDGRYPEDPPPPPDDCTPCDPCDPNYPCEEPVTGTYTGTYTGTTGGGWRPCWVCTHEKLYYVENIEAPPSTNQPDVYDASMGVDWFGAFAVDPFDPEGFQFCHSAKHFQGAFPLLYKSRDASPGVPPWARIWRTLVEADEWGDELSKYGGTPNIMKMVGLELDINKEGRIYISIDSHGGPDRFWVIAVCFSKSGGGLLQLDSLEVLYDGSSATRYYHQITSLRGQADGIRIGDFNIYKSSTAWTIQPNKLYVGGGNLFSANLGAYKKIKMENDYTSHPLDIFYWPYERLYTTEESSSTKSEDMRNRPIFVDPNCPDRIITWFPGLTDTQMEIRDYYSPHVSTRVYDDTYPCPTLCNTADGGSFEPGDIYGSHHHGVSITWHPEPGQHGKYIRFMDNYTNMFVYSDDEGDTFYELFPLGAIGVNTSIINRQLWIISLVQDEQSKLYMAKNGTKANNESDATGEPVPGSTPRDNMLCIAVHEPDPDHNDTTITFYDRSGEDNVGLGTVRMTHGLGCFAIVPVWTQTGED